LTDALYMDANVELPVKLNVNEVLAMDPPEGVLRTVTVVVCVDPGAVVPVTVIPDKMMGC